jgi:pyridoxal phosphate enzyme (YggS family)
MSASADQYQKIITALQGNATLVAVSKTKPNEDILALYEKGQRDFGENYVQELVDKQTSLPADIRWHFIGHLQSNKVKYIAPFVHLIHGVDSLKLLQAIDKEAVKIGRTINCLLQVDISQETTKFGMDEQELKEAIKYAQTDGLRSVNITGLMGMASFTEDNELIKSQFEHLKELFDQYAATPSPHFRMETLSMGMSADYGIALAAGSNMIRIGSLLFGKRGLC